MTKEELNFLKRVISFQTTSDNSVEIKKCLEFIKSFILSKAKCKVKLFVKKGKTSIIFRSGTNCKVSLIGHIDVVPADKKHFKLKIEEEKAFGRGILDMKGPIAAMVFSFCKLIKDNVPIELILTSDEETDGHNGIKGIVEKIKINSKIAVIPDGLSNFNLITAQKGPIHLFIKSKGKSAHASKPWNGENAVEKVLTCFNEIKNKFNLAKSTKDWLPSTSLTQINTQSAINQIPNSTEICIDLRLTEKEKDWLKQIEKICKKHNCMITKIRGDGKVFRLKNNFKIINLWKQNVKAMINRECTEVISTGASDARHLPKNTISILTSLDGDGAHSENEWIDIHGIKKLELIIEKFVKEIYQNPNIV